MLKLLGSALVGIGVLGLWITSLLFLLGRYGWLGFLVWFVISIFWGWGRYLIDASNKSQEDKENALRGKLRWLA